MTRPLPPSPERRYPLVIGLALAGCYLCDTNTEHEFSLRTDGAVRGRCLDCGRVGYEVSLHEAQDWLRGVA